LLGETTLSEQEASGYVVRYGQLIEKLAEAASQWPDDALIDFGPKGRLPRVNVSMKISALDSQLKECDADGCVDRLYKKLLPLFVKAKEKNVFVNLDLEQWSMHAISYDLFERLASSEELRDWPHLGIVVQAYLRSAMDDLQRLESLAKWRACPLTIRLVKGAYWDYEVVVANQNSHPCPVFQKKSESDANYEALSEAMLLRHEHLNAAFGSHNLRSLAHAIAVAQSLGLPKNSFEIQMLYGMAEPERKTMRKMGHRVRVYAPVGDMLPGMAYLVRRLLENTSNEGFLQQSHHKKASIEALLSPPSQQSNLSTPSC
jgi:RHH-type proline utilization regulon transcriptional repressor/proline dehydrogenase/delta 1-pyrroline-5-carboxylate dehydrogenase